MCAAETKEVLLNALLSEYHDSTRTWCHRFLDHFAQLSSDLHHWVLQLLSDNMQVADSKPQYCLAYYDLFAAMITSLPKQTAPVSLPGPCFAPHPWELQWFQPRPVRAQCNGISEATWQHANTHVHGSHTTSHRAWRLSEVVSTALGQLEHVPAEQLPLLSRYMSWACFQIF